MAKANKQKTKTTRPKAPKKMNTSAVLEAPTEVTSTKSTLETIEAPEVKSDPNIPAANGKSVRPWLKMPRKQWTKEEKSMVAEVAVQQMRSCGIGIVPDPEDRGGSIMLLDAVRTAQSRVLPPERRRIFHQRAALESSRTGGVSIVDLMTQMFLKAREEKQRADEEAAKAKAAAEAAAQVPPVAVATVPGVLDLEQMHLSNAGPLTQAAVVLVQLLQRVEKTFREQEEMQSLLMTETAELRGKLASMEETLALKLKQKAEEPAAADLPVVAVLGCQKYEFEQLVEKVAERGLKIELRHYDQDSKPRPVVATYAIIFKWIGHVWEPHIDKSVERQNQAFIKGGLSRAVMQLEVWFAADAS